MNRLQPQAFQRALERGVILGRSDPGGSRLAFGGLQARLEGDAGRCLLRGQLAVQQGGRQPRVQCRGIDAVHGGAALPLGWIGSSHGFGELPLAFDAATGAGGLQRLDRPLPIHEFDLGVEPLQRQALLVPWTAERVGELQARLPARACRGDGCSATQPRLRCLWPQRGEVQRQPARLKAGDRLQLPGLDACFDVGLHHLLLHGGRGLECRYQLGLQRQGGVTPRQCAGDAGTGLHADRLRARRHGRLHAAVQLERQRHWRGCLHAGTDLVVSR